MLTSEKERKKKADFCVLRFLLNIDNDTKQKFNKYFIK